VNYQQIYGLTCGNTGCGRKNWDGTGGNSHGIEHY